MLIFNKMLFFFSVVDGPDNFDMGRGHNCSTDTIHAEVIVDTLAGWIKTIGRQLYLCLGFAIFLV